MTFSIVGTGNIALFFGLRLIDAGHICTGVYSRNSEAAHSLAIALTAGRWGGISDAKEGADDICILAVSDTAISAVAAQLSFSHTVLMHTAGSVALSVLRHTGAHTAVLWPVYSINKSSLPHHRSIPCAWEASSARAAEYVQLAGHAISDNVFEALYEQRKWLHLSAVIGNNFTNHLMAICEQICIDNQLPFSVLTPIIQQTFDRLKNASPEDVQTGPAIRRDTVTIDRQLALLHDHPAWQKVYAAITGSIQHI